MDFAQALAVFSMNSMASFVSDSEMSISELREARTCVIAWIGSKGHPIVMLLVFREI
jgi:type IV secretory pathway TraG/TraD family ATPase VirD4